VPFLSVRYIVKPITTLAMTIPSAATWRRPDVTTKAV